jgi:hypothetical protein
LIAGAGFLALALGVRRAGEEEGEGAAFLCLPPPAFFLPPAAAATFFTAGLGRALAPVARRFFAI